MSTSVAAKADSLTLTSASNGTYQYSFTENDVPKSFENCNAESLFILSGLSGITGASSTFPSVFTATFNNTSATFTFTGATAIGLARSIIFLP